MFLERRNSIQRSAFVNPFLLGLTHHGTLLSLPLESQKHLLWLVSTGPLLSSNTEVLNN
jgi:hypothetical protein